MSNKGYSVIATSVLTEQWPGYIPVNPQLLRWSSLSQIKFEVLVDLEVDPTEESNAVSWGNN